MKFQLSVLPLLSPYIGLFYLSGIISCQVRALTGSIQPKCSSPKIQIVKTILVPQISKNQIFVPQISKENIVKYDCGIEWGGFYLFWM